VRVVLHPEARAELRAAALWYEEQRPGLGGEFVAEVAAVLDRIAVAPQSFPLWPGVSAAPEPVRRGVMHRFPYVVAFEAHEDHVLLLAIAHGKRQPLYWLARRTG
jgi:plasmid stabilization system protein ParE